MSSQQSEMPHDAHGHRVGKKKRKVAKPVEVWYRASNGRMSLFFKHWILFGRYKDVATAQQVVDQKRTDHYFEYEVRL